MKKYKGYTADQYGTVYDSEGYAVGKLNNETLRDWVNDYEFGLAVGVYQ